MVKLTSTPNPGTFSIKLVKDTPSRLLGQCERWKGRRLGREGKATKGEERKGKERKWKVISIPFFPLFSFFLSVSSSPIIFFTWRTKTKKKKKKEGERRRKRRGNERFFLSKERPPDRVPRTSFENLKGGPGATLGLKRNFYCGMVIYPRLKIDTPPWGVMNYP